MEHLQSILNHFELIETFVIKTTILISAIVFCLSYIWNHIKEVVNRNNNKK